LNVSMARTMGELRANPKRETHGLVCLSLAGLLVASSPSYAEVLGTCSCKSDTCRGRWELRAANLKALRAQCRAKTDDRGLLSRVHRPKR